MQGQRVGERCQDLGAPQHMKCLEKTEQGTYRAGQEGEVLGSRGSAQPFPIFPGSLSQLPGGENQISQSL